MPISSIGWKSCKRRRNGICSTKSFNLIITCVLLLLLAATITASQAKAVSSAFLSAPPNNCQKSLRQRYPVAFFPHTMMKASRSDSDAGNNDRSSVDEDARAFNTMASSSVDVADAYVRNGILTVTRSVRDFDANTKRRFLYHIPVPSGDDQSSARPRASSFLPPPVEVPQKIKARIPSPTGSKVALLAEESTAENGADAKPNTDDNPPRQVLEIWTHGGHCLCNRIVLPNPSKHGKVCIDTAWFGAISWNAEEDALVYCAEMKPPKTSSFFWNEKQSASANANDKDNDTNKGFRGGQFTLGLGKGEDWGEKYTSTSRLSLFCVNIHTGRVGSIENVPGSSSSSSITDQSTTEGGYTLGQPIFSPCGSSVIYTGWDAGGGGEMPKRLGSIYCYQRPSKLYASPVSQLLKQLAATRDDSDDVLGTDKDEECVCLTPKDRLARSARFAPSSSSKMRLAYLCSPSGFDTHGGCMALHMLDWDTMNRVPVPQSHRVLVEEIRTPSEHGAGEKREDVVDREQVLVGGMGFPGLFVNQLPDQCFSPDGRCIFATMQWGSIIKIVRISTLDASVIPVNFHLINRDEESANGSASQSLLCLTTEGGGIVTESEPNRPAVLGYVSRKALVGETSKVDGKATILATMPPIAMTSFASVVQKDESFTYHLLSMNPPHGKVKVPIQGILMLPKISSSLGKNPPLIVVPHGGPHSCSSTSYAPSYAYLCAHGGYAILHVNYRGSSGFGQATLESLTGSCGVQDVKDVVFATEKVIGMGCVDTGRVGICGGSHGGFLAAHCIGQYPNLFKVAAMRNPVTNIATMVTATDIPDWCYVETFGGGYYNWSNFRGPSKDELGAMWDVSPISHVEKVIAPTLIALGMSDRRVPPSQGIEYYHTLRSRGIKTKLLMYEKDDHAIDRVVSEADHWMNIKLWFDEHL